MGQGTKTTGISKTVHPDEILGLRGALSAVLEVADLHEACVAISDSLNRAGLDLLLAIFCNRETGVPFIRPFSALTREQAEVSVQLQTEGACPILEPAIMKGIPFDAREIPESHGKTPLAREFLKVLPTLDQEEIWVVPAGMGHGMAVFLVGSRERQFSRESLAVLSAELSQSIVNILVRFPELATVFEPGLLSGMEHHCMLLQSNGLNVQEIGQEIGLGEFSVERIIGSAKRKLRARTDSSAVTFAPPFDNS